jgi:hypothetical protein
MSADDDFHRFLKRWSKNVFNQDDTPEYSNLDRTDEYGDWSKRFLDHYDRTEGSKETGEDGTSAFIEKVFSDFLSYIDDAEEESKKSKKKK